MRGLVVVALLAGCASTPPDPGTLEASATREMRAGRLDEAIRVAERGADSLRRHGRGAAAARLDLRRAEYLVMRGGADDRRAANRIIADAYQPAIDDSSLRALWNYVRAYATSRGDDPSAALAALDAAERWADASLSSDVLIDSLFLREQVLRRLQRDDEARRVLERALDTSRLVGDRFRAAAARMNLGVLDMNHGRPDEAITHLAEAAAGAEAVGADLLRSVALHNLSICRWIVGDIDRAIEEQRAIIETARRAGLRRYLSQGLGMRGQMLLSRGRSDEALEALEDAYRLSDELGPSDDGALWAVCAARAQLQRGALDDAAAWIGRAEEGYLLAGDSEGLADVTLARGQLAAARGDDQRALELFADVAETVPDVLHLVREAHAESATISWRRSRYDSARVHFDAAIAAVESGRSRLFRIESELSLLTEPIEIYRDYVAMLLALGADDEALGVMESSRARTLLGDGATSAEPDVERLVAAARAHDVTLLSYWISGRGSSAWLFTPEGQHRIDLGPLDGLDREVDRYRAEIVEGWRDPLESGSTTARRLYDRLVRPLRPWLPDGTHVVVVPDGPLTALNLESLVVVDDGAAPRYLIRDLTLSVAPSLGALLDASPRTRPAVPSVLLVGDPVPSDPAFPPLPHAARELHAVAARLDALPVVELRGARATPAAVLDSPIEGFDWLHFAAHAQSNAVEPLQSSVVLSPGESGDRLRAAQIVDRELAAELVTLSACRTAGSRTYAGEGLVGLAWAFMRAGSTRVVAGLWDVSDRSTVMLMDRFYGNLASGRPPSEALRLAKLDLLRESPALGKPFYWAPFQLYTRSPDP